ncbi:PaaX family transcriptional regulator (plasmid) [Rhodococcus sp. p52]|uniref:PaaX family transcriptional regulator n=1 Tax=Actinomycetes TaxID=1760 RepID=UPI000691FA7D|nr:PaaX family transcriptional regulator C-terminal domain-containing protein [Rhodococcus sp. p52]AOD24879.1 PaaX family transcriptional regulator [Rhodococcus sp. p52]
MKPRGIVFDLFGGYLRYRGGEAPLRDLVALLERFGVGASSARVVMSRLRKEGWFDTRPGRDGREVVYALNERSWRMLDEGRERIFTDPRSSWDGWWHIVIYYVPETARATREELRKELSWLGFGPLAASTWISPHDRLARVEEKFAHEPDVRLDLLRARSKGLPADRDMAERCWDLDALNADYRVFLERYRAQLPRYRSGRLGPDEALVTRIELFHEWRKFPFRDPGLPLELLPARWRGHDAYQLFKEASELLLPAAERAIDSVTGTRPEEPVQMPVSTT